MNIPKPIDITLVRQFRSRSCSRTTQNAIGAALQGMGRTIHA